MPTYHCCAEYETLISNGMLQAANQEGSNRFRENKGITIIQQVLQRWVNGSYEPLGYFLRGAIKTILNKKLAILSVSNSVSISGDTRRVGMVARVAWVAVVGGVDLGGGQVEIMVRCLLVVWWTRGPS